MVRQARKLALLHSRKLSNRGKKNPSEIQLVIWVDSAPQLQQITPSNPLPVDICAGASED
jgi:hypothetical protein